MSANVGKSNSTTMGTQILNLPTTIIEHVVDYLRMLDLRSFRLTCRWAKHESFQSFARRGYSSPGPVCLAADPRALYKVLESSAPLARTVKSLKISLGTSKGVDDLTNQYFQRVGHFLRCTTCSRTIARYPPYGSTHERASGNQLILFPGACNKTSAEYRLRVPGQD